ncbi:MAG: hypothetical protein R2761_15970 [Acidimicrobiales bacterium]
MPSIAPVSAALASALDGRAGAVCAVAARTAHDLGLAAWFGGATMGAVALNAATREVEEHTQRLRVADAAWFRWAPVVAIAATAHFAGALTLPRLSSAGTRRGGPPPFGALRTALSLGAVLATAETGWSGRRVVSAGDVPVATAVQPIAATPVEVARAQRRLRVAQWLVPAFTAGIAVVNAVQHEADRRGQTLAGVPDR